ncbi:hypothetical protein ACQP3J_30720, partial [Escherichia coli]
MRFDSGRKQALGVAANVWGCQVTSRSRPESQADFSPLIALPFCVFEHLFWRTENSEFFLPRNV